MNMLQMKIKYNEHKRMVCRDLKVLSMLLGQRGVIPSTHAFCVYGTAQLKMNTGFVSNGQKEMSLQLEKKNILNQSLVSPDKVLLPPFHIKLGLMKQYVKSLDKGG